MTIIKDKRKQKQMLVRMQRKGTLTHCWWECKLVQPLRKRLWRFLKRQEIELAYDPVIPLLGIYPKELTLLCVSWVELSWNYQVGEPGPEAYLPRIKGTAAIVFLP
jgi:hypothetical protein